MSPRPRLLTEQDRAAWADYARQVLMFPRRETPFPPTVSQPADPLPAHPRAPPAAPPPRQGRVPLVTGQHPPGLDRSSWNRFQSGKLPAARTLDLHGKTAHAAFHTLQHFLFAAHAEQLRCVEIITGRGSGEHGGVIRRELPLWLNLPAIRPIILAASHPHPLNPGSTRVLLKRKTYSHLSPP